MVSCVRVCRRSFSSDSPSTVRGPVRRGCDAVQAEVHPVGVDSLPSVAHVLLHQPGAAGKHLARGVYGAVACLLPLHVCAPVSAYARAERVDHSAVVDTASLHQRVDVGRVSDVARHGDAPHDVAPVYGAARVSFRCGPVAQLMCRCAGCQMYSLVQGVVQIVQLQYQTRRHYTLRVMGAVRQLVEGSLLNCPWRGVSSPLT
jgi:hypothetical protein